MTGELMVTSGIDPMGMASVHFLDPFGLQGKSMICINMTWSINRHDGYVVNRMGGLIEVSGYRLVPVVLSVTTMFE